MNARDCLTTAYKNLCDTRPALRDSKPLRLMFTQLIMMLTNSDPDAPQCNSWDDVQELARQLVVLYLPSEMRAVEQDVINVFQAVVADARRQNSIYVAPTKV